MSTGTAPSSLEEDSLSLMFSTKSRHYLDLFIQRVKESFSAKENPEASRDTTRKSEMKNIQESLKQVYENIYIFSRSIEQLNAENETNLGRSFLSLFVGFFSSI